MKKIIASKSQLRVFLPKEQEDLFKELLVLNIKYSTIEEIEKTFKIKTSIEVKTQENGIEYYEYKITSK